MSVREIIIRPSAASWDALVRRRWEGADRERSSRFRAELGLPTTAPVVMSGHQPWVWHCGILAKRLACDAAAEALGAHAAWVWVDQDDVDPFVVRAPAEDEHGRLRSREYRLAPAALAGAPVGVSPAQPIVAPPDAPEGVREIARALGRHSGESSAGAQAARAVEALAAPVAQPIASVFATALNRTALFGELSDRMLREPMKCARAYNEAISHAPAAGLAPLACAGVIELPMWRLAAGAPRARAFADAPADSARRELAPRALFMTLLLRLAGCELFIHGAGGGEYDRATEAWARLWLGEELAPMTVVSATATLDLVRPAPPSPAEVARAHWLAHHARHSPAALGDSGAARRRQELLDEVRAARSTGSDAAPPYRALQEFLETHRRTHASRLLELREAARRAAEAATERRVLDDRTWAFPLHAGAALRELRGRIRSEFGLRG